MTDAEQRLFDLLMSKPAFLNAMPRGRALNSLVFKGTVLPGPIEWESDPSKFEVRPVGIQTAVGRNCTTDSVLTITGHLQGEYTKSNTVGWEAGFEIGKSIEASGKIPFVAEGKVTTEVKLSVGVNQSIETKETLKSRQGYSIPTLPGRELDVQLQVMEQVIDGLGFAVDLELRGLVDIVHDPEDVWVPYRNSLPPNAVVAGEEKNAAGTHWRDLVVCRTTGTGHLRNGHAGKVIGSGCQYGFGGEERVSSTFEVLAVQSDLIAWQDRDDFEKANSERRVAEGRATAFYSGKENRATGRYSGHLLVCRAEHNGNLHPGKVVADNCNIGFGGRELRKRSYQVLTKKGAISVTTPVRIETYLTDIEERSFRMEGTFDDVRASTWSTVAGPTRPVDPSLCPAQAASEIDTSFFDVTVENEPEQQVATVRSGTTPVFYSASGLRVDAPPPAPVYEAPLASARTLTVVDLDGEDPVVRINARVMRDLPSDMFGADVLAVQQALGSAGFAVTEDGFYGRETAKAIRAFQQANGLAVDGVLGPLTQAALGI